MTMVLRRCCETQGCAGVCVCVEGGGGRVEPCFERASMLRLLRGKETKGAAAHGARACCRDGDVTREGAVAREGRDTGRGRDTEWYRPSDSSVTP